MLSIVIPTYNRGPHLKDVTQILVTYMLAMGKRFELIYVDDCSMDDTAILLRDIVSENEHVTAIVLEENAGQQNATLAGMRTAKGDLVMTMDDDLRYGLSGIAVMLAKLEQGYDVVYGISGAQDNGLTRHAGTLIKEHLFRLLCHKPKDIDLSSFRVMRRSVADYVCSDASETVYVSARLLKLTKNIASVPVESPENLNLPTNYTLKKLGRALIWVFRNYTALGYRLRLNRDGEQYRIKEVYR